MPPAARATASLGRRATRASPALTKTAGKLPACMTIHSDGGGGLGQAVDRLEDVPLECGQAFPGGQQRRGADAGRADAGVQRVGGVPAVAAPAGEEHGAGRLARRGGRAVGAGRRHRSPRRCSTTNISQPGRTGSQNVAMRKRNTAGTASSRSDAHGGEPGDERRLHGADAAGGRRGRRDGGADEEHHADAGDARAVAEGVHGEHERRDVQQRQGRGARRRARAA